MRTCGVLTKTAVCTISFLWTNLHGILSCNANQKHATNPRRDLVSQQTPSPEYKEVCKEAMRTTYQNIAEDWSVGESTGKDCWAKAHTRSSTKVGELCGVSDDTVSCGARWRMLVAHTPQFFSHCSTLPLPRKTRPAERDGNKILLQRLDGRRRLYCFISGVEIFGCLDF